MVRKAFGLILFAAGCAFAATAYHHAPADREDNLAEVTRILTNPGLTAGPSVAVRPEAPVPSVAPSSPKSAAVSVADANSSKSDWQSSVSSTALTSTKPGDSSARYDLVRSVQKELKRAGCYNGEAHGSWTGSSKRALKAFMERVNATLPVDEPDYVQLSLLQSKSGVICGAECPKGQSLADGRCLPSAIVAQAPVATPSPEPKAVAKVSEAKPDLGWTTTTKPVPASEIKETVVASVEPMKPEPSKPVPSKAPEKEILPWQQSAANDPIVAPVKRKSPPPGRMAVGAPLPEVIAPTPALPTPVSESLPVATPDPLTAPATVEEPKAAQSAPAVAEPAEIKTASIDQSQEPIESYIDLEPDPSAAATILSEPEIAALDGAATAADEAAVPSLDTFDAAQEEPVIDSEVVNPSVRKKRKAARSEARSSQESEPKDQKESKESKARSKPRTKVAKYYYAPKFFSPKIFSSPKFVVYKAPRRYASRGTRSVQSLFTHPLGRM